MASQNNVKNTPKKCLGLYSGGIGRAPTTSRGSPPPHVSFGLFTKARFFKEPYTTVSWGVFCGGEDNEIWDLLGRALCEPKPRLGRPAPGR